MFENIYLIFAILVFINKFFITSKIHKIKKIEGEISFQWITKSIYIFYILPIFVSPIEFFIIERNINYYISGIAFVLYILGWMLSIWAIKTLDKYWTVEIEIRDVHPLIKKGPYKYMRHPHYLFLFCEILGLPLIANAYYSFFLIVITFVPLIILRFIFEEKALIKKFGEEYLKYKKEVWAFFPIPIFKTGVKDV